MAEFKLERFRYSWKGDWTSSTAYKRDDIVRLSGKSYVCIITHTSSNTFRDDLYAILPGSNPPQEQPKWVEMTASREFVGEYSTGQDYNEGDIVLFGGILWICNTGHNATGAPSDQVYWDIFSTHIAFAQAWQSSTLYGQGSLVKYNGEVYKCVNYHISNATLELNSQDWEKFFVGIEWRGDWTPTTEYRTNDLVSYGATIFRCTQTHISDSFSLNQNNFEVEVFGSQYNGLWNATTYYNIGDIVNHEGFMYYSLTNNINSKPFLDTPQGSSDWVLLARNTNFKGDWQSTNVYKTGDVVRRGANLYLALRDIGGQYDGAGNLIGGELLDGSTLDYLEEDTWELLIPGKSWTGNWTSAKNYKVGDIAVWKGSAYVCNFEHESSMVNRPEDNGSGYVFWDLLIEAGRPAGMNVKGDLLTYGLSRQLDNDGSTVFDDSTLGDTRVPIGNAEQILSVSEDLEVFWRNITEDADTVFVSTSGIDEEGRGTFQKPFKTIKFAAAYVEDNYTPGSPVIIRVSAGKFEEVAPIIVPAGCAINGDELRSTTILANSALAGYVDNYQYVEMYLDHFTNIAFDVITGVPITPQSGNTNKQEILETTIVIDENTGLPLIGEDDQPITTSNNFPVSNEQGLNLIVSLINDYKNYIEFRIQSGDTDPSITGSNDIRLEQVVANAAEALHLNRSFLQSELAQYIVNQNPNINFDMQQLKVDVWFFIRGLVRDIRYDGNYATLLSAARYANAVTGSQNQDLFYLRDTTGLRDCTTGGLQGALNPPGVFDLYQKPTGGSLVSLDPGWGPLDTRTWISTRSPYIQGVTNTGTGCTGMKVDGALHAGGNKSMTANDFTQVLSDGIGAWITNNARAELVSVFTYYCQIGYFAEDGGIIRATNGNNSYGKYGSIADGIDADEVPQTVTIFNRNNQAQVAEAFAGGVNDELFAFEYTNGGEEYSTADATIVGAGSNADVEYTDFRDNGIYTVRLTSPDGSSKGGGSGYLRRQGSAQETADATSIIKLSSSETIQFLSEIQGMRITITDGLGVGQYGYVDDYNFTTKEVTVRKDSDDSLGWDHIIAGKPLVATFDLTTRYRIEPRVTVPTPPFSATSGNLFTTRTYSDMIFGQFTQTYTNISAGSTIIWKDDDSNRVLVNEIVSDIAVKFTGNFAVNPNVPFDIKGRTTGATATITAITANINGVIEAELDSGGSNFQLTEEIDIIQTAGSGDTFDAAAVPAVFAVTRKGFEYEVTTTNAGAGYSAGDKIIISGASLGGTSPANDLRITVTGVTDDSTSSIETFTTSGKGRSGRFISLANIENARYSDNGTDWIEVTLPFTAPMRKLIAGDNKFIAVARDEARIASSLDGVTWTEVALPQAADWESGTYGNGKFVIVSNADDLVAVSSDGNSWTISSIPDDTDGGVDSTQSNWTEVAYGNGKYVAVSSSDGASATSTDGITWTRHDGALFGADYVEYGNNRFVALDSSEGFIAYSFDGVTWYNAGSLTTIASIGVGQNWRPSDIKYSNGLFMAVGTVDGIDGNFVFTSEDGILWTKRIIQTTQRWATTAYGNNTWIAIATAADTGGIAIMEAGCRAKLRVQVGTGILEEIRIYDPGSNYLTPPVVTITDPNFITEATTQSFVGNNVLAQPDFVNRGAGYRSSTSTITISGDGFADILPTGNTITVSGIVSVPGPGVQIEITDVVDPDAVIPGDLATFSGVEVFDLGDDGTGNETRLVQFTISPSLDVQFTVPTGTTTTLREQFSQCRITGHDFLDIGTGNFESTNYPGIYSGGNFFTAAPENEVYEANGGRIFYVSTDQDGNFRTGELFSVQQATGIVTISAQFFDLDGLSELALGGVRLGGSGTVVNEFSTDPTFAADSNNVIPTQRAIATFLANRLSVGGESLEVNRLQAGRVILGGDINEINTSTGQYLIIPPNVVFDGTFETNDGAGNITTEQTSISGTIVSQMLYFKQFDESMQ